ncbi:class D sortase [Fictibacillus iocasae]|uniref:Class D sortase n=1 Tax=Fictibacillus iocasae TaxID=2715437 RepID=A0ABW2NR72_9BACL
MKKRIILMSIAVSLIAGGAWFTTTSVYQFAKGYFAFKVLDAAGKAEVKVSASAEKEREKEKTEASEDELYPVRPSIGDDIGKLIIPKLDASISIYHGTNEDELEKGVGHFADSVLPGEKDNSVLSGHRDTVFRRLGEVGKGDELVVQTSAGTFTYKVRQVRIVDKEDRSVIVPMPRATLTVSTCYPFTYVGAAPERYVLVASLIKKEI